MKKTGKILLFIVSLAGLVLSIGMVSLYYPIPFITGAIMGYQGLLPWLNAVFAGYSVFLCLCFFLLLLAALFIPGESGDVILTKSKGKLRFSKQTVESTVRYSFADVSGINSSRVRAKIYGQPEKTKIYVKLSVNDPGKLAGMSETIQDQIGSALQSSLGVTAKSIDIKVVELSRGGEVKKENLTDMVSPEDAGDAAKTGRVI